MPPYLDRKTPRVLAHRGLAIERMENTAGAFQAALDAGTHYIETDAHASADGVAVLWHDPDLRRFSGQPERLADLSWEQLRSLDVDGNRLQSLAEALATFPNARFNIDLKEAAVIEPVVRAIRDAGAVDRVLLASFSNQRRRVGAAALPGVASSPGMSAVFQLVLALALPRPLRRRAWQRALSGAVAVQVPEREYGLTIVGRRFVETAHELGVEVHVWTVNSADDMRRLLHLGVDGIVTDRAELAVAVIAQ